MNFDLLETLHDRPTSDTLRYLTFDPLARYLNQRSARYERRALLRPMATGEMSDAAMRAYRALGAHCLKLTAVPALFATAAIYFLIQFVLPMFGQTSDPTSVQTQVTEAAFVLALVIFVALPLIIFSLSLASALITSLVSDFMVGNVPNPEESRTKGIKKLFPIFLFGIRQALLGSGGLIFGVLMLIVSALMAQGSSGASDEFVGMTLTVGILGIVAGAIVMPIVYAYEALAVPAIMVENMSVRQAAKRSRALMRPLGRQPSGIQYVFTAYSTIFLLLMFLIVGVSAAIGFAAFIEAGRGVLELGGKSEIVAQLLEVIPVFLAVWFLVPVWATMTTILYYERRVRLEGYDIETLGRDVGRTHKSNRFEL